MCNMLSIHCSKQMKNIWCIYYCEMRLIYCKSQIGCHSFSFSLCLADVIRKISTKFKIQIYWFCERYGFLVLTTYTTISIKSNAIFCLFVSVINFSSNNFSLWKRRHIYFPLICSWRAPPYEYAKRMSFRTARVCLSSYRPYLMHSSIVSSIKKTEQKYIW